MADLITTISESLTLNGNQQGGKTTYTISGINDSYKRIIEVPSTEITLYTTNATAVGGSQFESDLIEYARITNLDSSNSVDLIIANSASDEVGITLAANKSFILNNHLAALDAAAAAITVTDGIAAIYRYAIANGNAANGMTEKQAITIVDSKSVSKKYVITDTGNGGVATGTILSDSDNTDTGTGTAGSAEDGAIAVGINISSADQDAFLAQLKAAIEHANGHGASSFSVGSVSGTGAGANNFDVTSVYKGDSGNNLPTENIANFTVSQNTAGVDGFVANTTDIASIKAIAQTSSSAGTKVELFIASK